MYLPVYLSFIKVPLLFSMSTLSPFDLLSFPWPTRDEGDAKRDQRKESTLKRWLYFSSSALIDYQTARSLTWLTPSAILLLPLSFSFYSHCALLGFHEKHTEREKASRHGSSAILVPSGAGFVVLLYDGMASIGGPPFLACLFLLPPPLSSTGSSPWPYHACGRRRCCLPVRSLLIEPKEKQCRQSYEHNDGKEEEEKKTRVPAHLLNGTLDQVASDVLPPTRAHKRTTEAHLISFSFVAWHPKVACSGVIIKPATPL